MSLPLLAQGRRIGVMLIIAVGVVLLLAAPAAAHTGFESSSPADGETISEPVAEVSLTFSGDATPAGDGFVVLDADGVIRTPDDITSTDNLTWTLRFEEPLAGGLIGLRWKVAAPDAHPIEGSFSFTVDAPSDSAASNLNVSPPADSLPVPKTAVAPEPEAVNGGATADDAVTETTESLPAAQESSSTVDLADFLDTGDSAAAGVARVGDVGRAISLLGVVLAIGGIMFAALTLRGNRGDIRAVLFWVRRAGAFTMLGVVVEVAAHVANLASGWSGLWSPSALADALVSAFGVAALLRFLGGALVLAGAKLDVHSASTAADPVVAVKQLALAGASASMSNLRSTQQGNGTSEPLVHDGDEAWHIAESPVAFLGTVLLVGSFLFDGHTVSEGPRWLHAVANVIHVSTAATWAGGVVMLTLVIARRHRRNADTRALQLAVRFSVVATISLIGATVAGTALALVILDSVSEIWSTSWGLLLVAKVLLVGAVATGGAYNHRVVIPALERSPDDQAVAHRFRMIVTIEAIGLILVTVLTAVLVAASST